MLISIIIPIYNVEKYLSQCLDSVINQTYKNLEIICVNDASTDNSLQILKKYAKKDNRIKIIENNKNLGVGLSRNKGIDKASGTYIHFLDPDDWIINENTYTELIEHLQKTNNLDLLYFKYLNYFSENEIKPQEYKNKNIINKILNPIEDVEVFDNWDRYVWSRLYRKDFLISNKIYFKNYISLSDVEFAALTYTNCNKLMYIDKTYIMYRRRQNSLSTTALTSLDSLIQQYYNNKKMYDNLPNNIKYKLLGFDFALVKIILEESYKAKLISTFKLLKYCLLLNEKIVNKYEFTNPKSTKKISLLKIILKCRFYKLFKFLKNVKGSICNAN